MREVLIEDRCSRHYGAAWGNVSRERDQTIRRHGKAKEGITKGQPLYIPYAQAKKQKGLVHKLLSQYFI